MRFKRLAEFDADFSRLSREHRAMFLDVIPAFNAAYAANPATIWPKRLRVSQMKNTQGIWEMTWSFSSPDGRATFHLDLTGGQTTLVWRRIGYHAIYKKP